MLNPVVSSGRCEIETKLPEPTIPSRACLSSPFDGLSSVKGRASWFRRSRPVQVHSLPGSLGTYSTFAYSVHAKSRSGPRDPVTAVLCGRFIAGLPPSHPIRRRSKEEGKKRSGVIGCRHGARVGTYQEVCIHVIYHPMDASFPGMYILVIVPGAQTRRYT